MAAGTVGIREGTGCLCYTCRRDAERGLRVQTDSWRLAGGVVAALAVLMFGFSGVYSGPARPERDRSSEKRQAVRLEMDETQREAHARRVVPLRSLDERTALLNRETPFIATKENPWSGQNAEQTKSWADARPDAGSAQVPDTRRDKQPSSSAALAPVDNDQLFPVEHGAFARATVEQIIRTERMLSPFQELPQELRPDSRLLVHFDSRGQISLGAMAEKNAEYFHAMVRKISSQWNIHFPKFQHFYGLLKDGEIFIVFELDLDGAVTSVRIVQSYGQTSVDESCIRAIQGAGTFGPIPREYRERGKMIVPFVFVYQRPERPLRMFH